jgi:hypothetical protein
MAIEGMFLASYGFFGGGIGNFLNNLEGLGFFDYALPFLIIFAVVFGILSKVKLFGESSRNINGIIALSVGLMALQFGIVSTFFAEIFPRFGVGLSIILVSMILLGLFIDPEKDWINYILLGIAAIILVVILIQSADGIGFTSGYWFSDNWPSILAVVVILGAIGAVVAGSGSGSSSDKYRPFYFREGGKP